MTENARSQVIVKSGYLFIITNFLLAVFNLLVGLLAHSIAITSDAAHSLIDAVSGFVVVIGEKLARTPKHAAQRQKIERISTLVVATIILLAGAHIVYEAIEKLAAAEPETPDYSTATVIVLVGSILAKFTLATYLNRRGARYHSKVLSASGAETMNDMLISLAVFASVMLYFAWGINVEAYLSLGIAVIIFKIGLEFIFPHLSRHHHHPLESNPDHDHCGKPHPKA